MTDKELFFEVFNRFQVRHRGLSLSGTLVSYNHDVKFNIDGFNLEYNLLRLCQLLDDEGELC